MRLLILQSFFIAFVASTALTVGDKYTVEIVDLDGRKFSTADGRVTTLVIASSQESERARRVGDATPDSCLGNPQFRMITALEFASPHSAPVRAIIRKVARRRVDAVARALQARYDALQIRKNARDDVIVVADFDNAIAAQVGISFPNQKFAVLILDGKGGLRAHWSDVPSRTELEAALRGAQ